MPELPEVESTIIDLKYFIGSSIKTIKLNRDNLRYSIPKNIPLITKNTKIQSINRIAKYIIINLNNSFSLIVHLGMSGRLKAHKLVSFSDINYQEKHDHVEIILKDKFKIVFNDPRRFGLFDIIQTRNIKRHKYFKNLGLDPLDKNFNSQYLYNKIKNSNSSIKSLLLNQRIVSGIGNIYACEILFISKISPFRRGNQISKEKVFLLVRYIKKILKLAIRQGGTTIRDYKSVSGELGKYQNNFLVYNKDGYYIKINNKKAIIVRKIQSGRSTYYCPYLQR
tara:strand:- start:1756 stop:2595 length:840 start_codon:yes stop_codon:yes gene_type:complete